MSCSTSGATAGKPIISLGVLITMKSRGGVDFLIDHTEPLYKGGQAVRFHLYMHLWFRWTGFVWSTVMQVKCDSTWLDLLTTLQPPSPKLIPNPSCCNTAVKLVWIMCGYGVLHRGVAASSSECNTSSEVTVCFSSASQPVRDSEDSLCKVLVSVYTVSLNREAVT